MPSQLPFRLSFRGRAAAAGSVVVALALLGTGLPAAHAAVHDVPIDQTSGAPAQIVVRWKDSATSSGRARARTSAETTAAGTLGDDSFQIVRPKPGQSVSDALGELRADPRVASADRDHYLTTFSMPDDPDLPKQWALQSDGPSQSASSTDAATGAIDVGPAWDRTVGSPQTVVAVIDGGYNFDVPDLGEVAWQNSAEIPGNGIDDDNNSYVDDTGGWDFVGSDPSNPTGDNDPTDDDPVSGGHGAHVAGILGAQGNDGQGITGVAQDVRVMPLRVCARSAALASNRCLLSAVVQAVNYAGANGARVANLSIGGGGYDQVFADALASNPKTLYVVAAGNDSRDNEEHPVYPCSYNPVADSKIAGRVDNVTCVAALDQQGRPATFSNWGVKDVDIAAPGVDIWSVFREYARTVVWSDDFEGDDFASNWINGDPGFGVGAPGDGPLASSGLTDSPGAAPTEGDHHVESQWFTVPASAEYCEIQGQRFAKFDDAGDFSYSLWVDGAQGPATLSRAVTWPKTELKSFGTDVFDASGLAGKQVSLHFDYAAAAGLDASYGIWLDNLKVSCGSVVKPAPYKFLSGTSMASPMVAGAAALLFSLKPSATVAQVRAALLGGAKKTAAWRKLVASGGRLDVAAAMGHLVPPDTEFASAPEVSGQSVGIHAAQNGALASIRFQCRIDSNSYLPCNPNGVVRNVHPGHHAFYVRAVDPYGNVDLSPATVSFTVSGCLVPKILGSSLARVRAVMPRTGCVLGTVVKPAGVPLRKLRVKYVGPSVGSYLPAGTRVKVVLVKR